MEIRNVGLITYQHPHLKTEQILQRLLCKNYAYKIYALPFNPRPDRACIVNHRPNQMDAIEPAVIAKRHDITYIKCDSDKDIDNSCDVYLVLGAGILSPECLKGKDVINCHPGVIPTSRGLDSFKWAILDLKPLGVTLHYINEQVDAGEIISVKPTNVYETDSLNTLSRRHYENEIEMFADFDIYLNATQNLYVNIEPSEPRMRMPKEREVELESRLVEYKRIYGQEFK